MAKTTVGPAMPAEAKENGGQINSQGLDASRTPATVEEMGLSTGPKVGVADEFLPAAYRLESGNIRIDS